MPILSALMTLIASSMQELDSPALGLRSSRLGQPLDLDQFCQVDRTYTDTSVDVGPASEPAHITGADPTR